MADEKHVLNLPKDYLNTVEISEEYFSPICESSALKEYLSSPTEYFSPYATPQTSKKEFLDKKLNSNMFEMAKKISEKSENELSLNDSSNSTEMDFTRSKYHNNADPAIEKLMTKRMIKMPNSSTPKNSQTSIKRIFSPNYCSAGKANEDSAINLTRKRLDASFSSPKALATREQSVNSSTLRVRLTKEMEPLPQMVQALSTSQKFMASFLYDDEKPIAAALYKDVTYVSEVHFLLMASNRNRRMRMAASRRRSRCDSRDSAFSEFMESDSE